MLSRLRNLLGNQSSSTGTIEGIRVEGTTLVLEGIQPPSDRIPVGEITRVLAYKQDLLTSDLVCFMIDYCRQSGDVWHVVLHEDMPGFQAAERALSGLPGFDSDWRGKVIKPAFAINETLLFQRAVDTGS
jgi:hypothetical protein